MTLKEDSKMTADVRQDHNRVSDDPHHTLHEAVQPLDQALRDIDAHLQAYPTDGQERVITRQDIGKTYEALGTAISRYTEHPGIRRMEGYENQLAQLGALRAETEMIGRTLSRDASPANSTELELHRGNLEEIQQWLNDILASIRAFLLQLLGENSVEDVLAPHQVLQADPETRPVSYSPEVSQGAEVVPPQERDMPEANLRSLGHEPTPGELAAEVEERRAAIETQNEAEEEAKPAVEVEDKPDTPNTPEMPEPPDVPQTPNAPETQPTPETKQPAEHEETKPLTYVKDVSENEATVGRFGEEANRPFIVEQGNNARGELNTCGVASQAMILNELTNSHDYTEGRLLEEAISKGLYQNGTALEDYGELAKLHGMKVEKGESSTEELVKRLAHGEAAQVSVNAGILWNDESAYGNGAHNHAVFITGADVIRNANGELEVQSVWVNDSGNGRTYEVPFERFAQAWATSNNFAAYISNPNE